MILLFPHPLYWCLRRRIRLDQEAMADAAASGRTGPINYAEMLVRWCRAAKQPARAVALLPMAARPSQLKRRIRTLVNCNLPVKFHCSICWRLCAWALIAAATLALSVLTLRPLGVGAESPSSEKAASPDSPGRDDPYGDPLPEGAIARLGTVRFRHGAAIAGLAFSPDGKTVASAGYARFIKIWEVESGKLLRAIDSGGTSVRSFAWSHDGRMFAGVSSTHLPEKHEDTDVCLRIWDAESGRVKATIKEIDVGDRPRVLFSPDDLTILITGKGGSVRFFDVPTREEILDFKLSVGTIRWAAFSPDGKMMGAAGDRGVHLWNWQEGKKPIVTGLPRSAFAVAFSPDGKLAAAGGLLSGVRLLDVTSGEVVRTLKSTERRDDVFHVAFSPNGKRLFSDGEHVINVWDHTTGELLRRLDISPDIDALLAVSADSRLLATGGYVGVVRIWDVAGGRELVSDLKAHSHTPRRIVFSPDGQSVATGSTDGTVRLWDLATQRQLFQMEHGEWVHGLAISADGTLLASSDRDGIIRLWRTSTGREIGQLPKQEKLAPGLVFAPEGQKLAFWSCPDSSSEVVPGGDSRQVRLHVWDTLEGRAALEHTVQPDKKERVEEACFSPDAKTFVFATHDYFYVYDVATGQRARKIPKEESSGLSMVISPDSKRLLTSAENKAVEQADGTLYHPAGPGDFIRVRDLATGKILVKIVLPTETSGQAAFSPDGRVIAQRSYQGPMRLFDAATGKELGTIEDVRRNTLSLAFSPDGKLLASGADDTSVLVWDLGPVLNKSQ